MRTGGLVYLARCAVAHALRGLGSQVARPFAWLADIIDPDLPADASPPREWQPRLWDRDQDPRTQQEERRP